LAALRFLGAIPEYPLQTLERERASYSVFQGQYFLLFDPKSIATMSSSNNDNNNIASEVLAACLGGAVSASALYPLEVLKTRMQAEDGDRRSSSRDNKDEDDDDDDAPESKGKTKEKDGGELTMIQYAARLYEKEGPGVFLRGIQTSAFQSALEKACYFFAYTLLKTAYHDLTGDRGAIATAPRLALAAAAEWAHLPVTLPVDAWTTAIQTSSSSAATGDKKESSLAILCHMLSDKNTNFYKGIEAYWMLCWKPAIQYTVYEQVKLAYLKSKKRAASDWDGAGRQSRGGYREQPRTSLTAAEAFALGMVARTIATVLVFPFIRAKVLMQTQQKQSQSDENDEGETGTKKKKVKDSAMMVMLYRIWQRQGLSGLYRGIGPELTRGIFSSALMLMIKERIALVVQQFLLGRRQRQQLLRT